ncbi:serine protease grass-like [Drosophila novamexicana]|uniref:serine protease grass-like n=1 Tax=Drosophila novamexicana TaxID=47314 RepID=UPI0011E5A5AD|nr:serine protease grass-like [Drosophila novamexicana]XP_030572009.1 serine protease grass-like [Drosophila novamexicana]
MWIVSNLRNRMEPIERVIVHEDFTFNEMNANDIALQKLFRKVKIQDHISPICLPVNATLQQQMETLPTLRLTGWGFDELLDTSIKGRINCIENFAHFGPVVIGSLCSFKKPVFC